MSSTSDVNETIEELSSILNNHLDYISELNKANPRLATILLYDLAFHIKNLHILKKED